LVRVFAPKAKTLLAFGRLMGAKNLPAFLKFKKKLQKAGTICVVLTKKDEV